MQRLTVSSNRRRLATEDGNPFFWMGDTAWELLHRLSLEEAEYYLTRRKEQGFNVIQAVILAELDGLRVGNANGDLPLHNLSPLHPNEAYFRHVDAIIKLAENLGIYMALLPVWGDKVLEPGDGPRIFHPSYEEQGVHQSNHKAFKYGQWLGSRYAVQPNIVWVLGGDRDYDDVNDPDGTLKEIWRVMARGLHAGEDLAEDNGHPISRKLITFHVCRGSSLYYPGKAEDWLDFHMTGSYHFARDLDTSYTYIERDYLLSPPKPTLDAEPRYEDHPINWKVEEGYFDDADVRQAAYWSVFAGACGHTYGCHDVWQFNSPAFGPVFYPLLSWREALELSGARQMNYLKQLIELQPQEEYIPEQSLLAGNEYGGARISLLKGNTTILIYSPMGKPIHICLENNRNIGFGYWMNPRNGEFIKAVLPTAGMPVRFDPPSEGRGNDWVLKLKLK